MKIHWVWIAGMILFLIGLNFWRFHYFKEESSKVAILGLSGVILAAITSVFTVVVNNSATKQRELEFSVLQEKRKAYSIFYEIIFKALKNQKKTGKKDDITVEEYLEFKKGVMNWGGEFLIKEFIVFDNNLNSEASKDFILIVKNYDRFLKAIRKDLGLETSNQVNLIEVLLDKEARNTFNQNK